MINGQYAKSVGISRRSVPMLALLAGLCFSQSVFAQGFGFGFGARNGVVGGINVDAQGAVRSASMAEQKSELQNLRKQVLGASGELANQASLRMVSLSKLQAKIAEAKEKNQPLSEEIRYLAGLQRIEYVFVYPDQSDIVLAGPAEGWKVREDATVVGETSGRPVLQLEDLLVAMRTVKAAQQQSISVSIDPTAAGQKNLERLLSRVRTGPSFNPSQLEKAMKKAFGPQMVTLTTVDNSSRMANTLVAADYRMKRLAMNLEKSPVSGLPSYMEMVRDGGIRGTQPRWWMACDYDAILHSQDMLAWKITGKGIKAMTEEEIVETTGARRGTGQTNAVAQKWADKFTEKFDELCAVNAAFGDLRNVMDLNVVATIIEGHQLENVAGCDFSLLKGSELKTPEWSTPQTIDPECSFVRGRSGWTVSASGGVEINPWKVVATQASVDSNVQVVHAKSAPSGENWWWN